LVIELSIPPLHVVPTVEELSHRLAYTLMVIGVAWLVLATLGVLAELLQARVPATDDPRELASRGLRTQLFVAQRIVSVVVWIVAAAVLLMQFELVRSIGVSLLASAGVAGVVLGVAAQRSLSGVVAGIQLSITQPIRLGDTVIVEGEYGIIEEINLTYVVVRIWDERRLIVPITQFLEKPFQNWTKVDPALHGTVLLQVDYATPVEALRDELGAIVAASPKWDQRTASIVVYDASDRTMTLRVTVSSKNPSDNFDLRCEVRERLIAFLRSHDEGRYLPVVRSAVVPTTAPESASKPKPS
jgi:small-conductance mechanosensitive channel